MPHAEVENLVTCSAPECVQPGIVLVPMGLSDAGEIIELEFCERHLTRAVERGTLLTS